MDFDDDLVYFGYGIRFFENSWEGCSDLIEKIRLQNDDDNGLCILYDWTEYLAAKKGHFPPNRSDKEQAKQYQQIKKTLEESPVFISGFFDETVDMFVVILKKTLKTSSDYISLEPSDLQIPKKGWDQKIKDFCKSMDLPDFSPSWIAAANKNVEFSRGIIIPKTEWRNKFPYGQRWYEILEEKTGKQRSEHDLNIRVSHRDNDKAVTVNEISGWNLGSDYVVSINPKTLHRHSRKHDYKIKSFCNTMGFETPAIKWIVF